MRRVVAVVSYGNLRRINKLRRHYRHRRLRIPLAFNIGHGDGRRQSRRGVDESSAAAAITQQAVVVNEVCADIVVICQVAAGAVQLHRQGDARRDAAGLIVLRCHRQDVFRQVVNAQRLNKINIQRYRPPRRVGMVGIVRDDCYV